MTMKCTQAAWGTERDGSLTMGDQVVSQPIGPDGSSFEEKLANTALMASARSLLDALDRIANRSAGWDVEDFRRCARAAINARGSR